MMLRINSDSLRLCPCLQLLSGTNFLQLLSAPLMATTMGDEFSELFLSPIILTLSEAFLNKSKQLFLRNTISHRHCLYSIAPIWIFNFVTGNLNNLMCSEIKNKQRKIVYTALSVVFPFCPTVQGKSTLLAAAIFLGAKHPTCEGISLAVRDVVRKFQHCCFYIEILDPLKADDFAHRTRHLILNCLGLFVYVGSITIRPFSLIWVELILLA